jgi:uroporphyrinogen decarboxylase
LLRDIVFDFNRKFLKRWLEHDIDGVNFGDDWGQQRALLISPVKWRKLFKPLYKELIDMCKANGKHILFHSDGNIMEIYPDFIEMGVDAVNSQIWCMGVEKVAEKFAGKISFWGEISRQDILPNGTPRDVKDAIELMKKKLVVNGGGLIGQSEAGADVPLENIEVALKGWNE